MSAKLTGSFFMSSYKFFCYSDIFAWFVYFAGYVSPYIFSYSAFELQVCLINSVQFSSVQGQGIRGGAINFSCVGQMRTLSSCVHQKDVAGSKGKASGQGIKRRQSPPKLKHLQLLKVKWKLQICLLLIFENTKITDICAVLQKWRLISYILACVWLPEGTLSSSHFLLGVAEGGARARTRGAAAPPLWRPYGQSARNLDKIF